MPVTYRVRIEGFEKTFRKTQNPPGTPSPPFPWIILLQFRCSFLSATQKP